MPRIDCCFFNIGVQDFCQRRSLKYRVRVPEPTLIEQFHPSNWAAAPALKALAKLKKCLVARDDTVILGGSISCCKTG
jgi:hypothetical protein